MAIDVTTPNSPGWWMHTLWKQLRAAQPRLSRLHEYRIGQPPLVLGSKVQQSTFYRFQKVSRSNFADLISSAVTDRMAVRSIRTAVATDDDADAKAWAIFKAARLDVFLKDVLYDMASLSVGYLTLGLDDQGKPVIVAEDPRQVTHSVDPLNPTRLRAAFKLFHDPLMGLDMAVLWLPGQRWIATRERKASIPVDGSPISVSFTPAGFTLAPFEAGSDLSTFDATQWATDEMLMTADDGYSAPTSQTYSVQKIPVFPFVNRGGVGEYELHTDLIDRIHHMVLQRIVIATFQAFKQRAFIPNPLAGEAGMLPETDEAGQKIDYTDMLSADPGSAWTMPPGMTIWESSEVDLSGILNSVKADIQDLGATTKTPFPMFSSDATNQTAEGAQLTREGLVFKVEDRTGLAGCSIADLIATTFAFIGDDTRSDPSQILVDWQPAERHSLAERSQADSLALSLPDEQKYRLIWGMSPLEVRIAVGQKAAQLEQAAKLAAESKPAAPAAVPPAPVVDSVPDAATD